MLSHRSAAEIADEFDLDALPACPLLRTSPESLRGGAPSSMAKARSSRRTADWVWMEIAQDVLATVKRLRENGVAGAEEALYDVEINRRHGVLARELTRRLAAKMAGVMRARGTGGA